MKIIDYIKETPKFLNYIIDQSESTFESTSKLEFDELYITGSGTSLNAALDVKYYMQDLLKKKVIVLNTFDIQDIEYGNTKKLLIGISQSGSSYSTLGTLKFANDFGIPTVSMTGEVDSIIDKEAIYNYQIKCGEEKAGAKTKGYFCTKLNLILFALYYAKNHEIISDNFYEKEIIKLRKDFDEMDINITNSLNWVNQNKDGFKEIKEIKVVGAYSQYGDVKEAALKLLEAMRIPVSGYEMEQFIHGIYNSTNSETCIFILDDGTEERIDSLKKVLQQWTDKIYIISNKENADFNIKNTASASSKYFSYIIPIWVICAKIPELKGINPEIPLDPKFHIKMNSKKLNS